ncbi:hypothetical protein [Methylobacterium soli]|jgi:hypothetical protein|nr:hypothetical protein [Methylobacterium soli]
MTLTGILIAVLLTPFLSLGALARARTLELRDAEKSTGGYF